MIIRTINETQWLGKKWCHLETVDSTNRKAKELAEAGCPHGTIVTAEEQTAGSGRRGRSWISTEGKGIYMSVVLRPQMEAEKASMVTLVAATAVARAIRLMTQDAGFLPFIKWPNDIVIRGKKVCGILTEMNLKEKSIDSVIVGIGVNVQANDFPPELEQVATTLERESGSELSKERLFELIVQQFEEYYSRFEEEQGIEYILEEYQASLANKGRKVTVLDPAGAYEGFARGITNRGELIVDTGEGTKIVSSGEVSVRGIYGYV